MAKMSSMLPSCPQNFQKSHNTSKFHYRNQPDPIPPRTPASPSKVFIFFSSLPQHSVQKNTSSDPLSPSPTHISSLISQSARWSSSPLKSHSLAQTYQWNPTSWWCSHLEGILWSIWCFGLAGLSPSKFILLFCCFSSTKIYKIPGIAHS